MIRFKKPDDPASRCRMIRLLEADNPHREAGSSGFMKQDNPAEAKDLFGKFDKLAITYSETANVSTSVTIPVITSILLISTRSFYSLHLYLFASD